MTTYKSARDVLAATLLTITLNSAPPAAAANQIHLPIATHQVRPDIQIHTSVRGVVPHLPMQSREDVGDPFADIHQE
jgi:hypothetical protein